MGAEMTESWASEPSCAGYVYFNPAHQCVTKSREMTEQFRSDDGGKARMAPGSAP